METRWETNIADWSPAIDADKQSEIVLALEQGKIIYLPQLTFQLAAAEQKFLSPRWLDGTRKNISLERGGVHGATGTAEELGELTSMIERFALQAEQFVRLLFPQYASAMYLARTSFRPAAVENRAISWRKDDSRLHVDAFPSRPNYGERILRVFSNVNPHGEPRTWRAGEPFKSAAQRYLPSIKRPLPGSAGLLAALGITKSRRSEYDHIMLHLHDALKADMDYQRSAPQQQLALAAGSTWICFTDQVLHAAMGGQYLLEQTLHLPVDAQYHPELSPLRTLEHLRGRALI
ncbi:MAG TPA: Kdo hydroxylase family protein [Spongiibacteraceae bacterium]|nr:Kdo hydroxylase family protein [Spongiibacteraceae bacterium]